MKNKTVREPPKYKFVEKIHECHRSLVYKGLRQLDQQKVILKFLNSKFPSSIEISRFYHEYEVMRQLKSDGVAKVYGIEKHGSQLMMIQEDFEGVPIKELSFWSMGLKQFLILAIRLVTILEGIHQHRIIHKNINPSNILWNHQNDVLKFIDFGDAVDLHHQPLDMDPPTIPDGTLAYISPEQTGRMNRFVEYQSDFYSLGVTFYEILTGQLPFRTTDKMELIHCHIAKIPEAPHTINPQIPAILSNIVLKMMNKNVEDRYQSTLGIKKDLQYVLERLEKQGDIPNYTIGKNDVSYRFQISQKLYGRSKEIKRLLNIYGGVCHGKKALMLISGPSGIGKSSLIHELYKPIVKKRGFFISGKSDPPVDVPYASLLQAFRNLIRQLLMGGSEWIEWWREKLQQVLGEHGQVIVDVIPEIEKIIGKQPAIVSLPLSESENRFNMVFRNFIGSFAAESHPLVIFLDNMQWIDTATLKIIEQVMNDTESGSLFFIGAYRDNEVDDTHPLTEFIHSIKKDSEKIYEIGLPNLPIPQINKLIANTLDCTLTKSRKLAEICFDKTRGNPLFLKDILTSFYKKHWITFDHQQGKWKWREDKINQAEISDNVMISMINEINQLPSGVQRLLCMAACIGNRFDLRLLLTIERSPILDVIPRLSTLLKKGIIIPLDNDYKSLEYFDAPATTLDISEFLNKEYNPKFKFRHNRLLNAACSLIDEHQIKRIHLEIGQQLQKKLPPDTQEEQLFHITNHFNTARELVTEKKSRTRLAKLNLTAGKKAKESIAYELSLSYLKLGIDMLDQTAWKEEYDLMRDLHLIAAESSFLNTDFQLVEQFVSEILNHTDNIFDRARSYNLRILVLCAQNRMAEAVAIGLEFLESFGVTLEEAPPVIENMEDLVNLPEITSPETLIGLEVLSNLFSAVYLTDYKLFLSVTYTMLKLALTGHSFYSIHAYIFYAFILFHECDFEKGEKIGEFGFSLLKKYEHKKALAGKIHFIYYSGIKTWIEKASKTTQPLRQLIHTSIEYGDYEFAGYSACTYSVALLLQGTPLDTVREELSSCVSSLHKIKQTFAETYNRIWYEWAVTMQQRNTGSKKGDSDSFTWNENVLKVIKETTNSGLLLYSYYLGKAILEFLFDNIPEALDAIREAKQYHHTIRGFFSHGHYWFYHSLILLAYCKTQGSEEHDSILERVETNQKSLNLLAKKSPFNFQGQYNLIEAEKANVMRDYPKAMRYFDMAVHDTKENGQIHEEGIACELAAMFYKKQHLNDIAAFYQIKACKAYTRWQATAKVRYMKEKYQQASHTSFQYDQPKYYEIANHLSGINLSQEGLDFSSVMKATRKISKEVSLSQLLRQLMQITIENAGAQKGFLILKNESGQWVIESESIAEEKIPKVLQSIPLNQGAELSQSVVNYVLNSKEPVVLTDAAQDTMFSEDPYIQSRQPKSLLCIPILRHDNIQGALYLENNLSYGVFTEERLKILGLLASQAAISIENARLYTDLEEKVTVRTRQLEEKTEELAQKNKEMTDELKIAEGVQKQLLTGYSVPPFLKVATRYFPHSHVSGDIYQLYLDSTGDFNLFLGDGAGHGVTAALSTMMVGTIITHNVEKPPTRLMKYLNRMLHNNLPRDRFMTAVHVKISSNGNINVVSAGHPPVIVIRNRTKEIQLVEKPGFPLGMFPNKRFNVEEKSSRLDKGDIVLLYTDGLTERQDPAKAPFGERRLVQYLKETPCDNPEQLIKKLLKHLDQYSGGNPPDDDTSIVSFQYLG